MIIPTYLFYFIAAGTVAVLVTILYGLNRALADAHWPAADRTRTLRVSAAILLGWLAAAITLSAIGIYHVASGDRPTIQYGILLPILLAAYRSMSISYSSVLLSSIFSGLAIAIMFCVPVISL